MSNLRLVYSKPACHMRQRVAMTAFDKAIKLVLQHEGGYVNHPSDPGGETNFGISKRAFPKLDIKNLTEAKAKEIYRTSYWTAIRGDDLPLPIAVMIFDFAVNAGVTRAVKMAQRILDEAKDGLVGLETIKAAHSTDINDFLSDYASERMNYYMLLPTFIKFGRGWIRRTKETLTYCLNLTGDE